MIGESLSKAFGLIDSAKYFPNPEFYGDLVYQFKKIIGNPSFSDLFKGIVNRFERAGYTLDIIQQTACLILTQLWLKAMLHSLVARRWFMPQTQ